MFQVILEYSEGRVVHAISENRPQRGDTSLWVRTGDGADRLVNLLCSSLESVDFEPLQTTTVRKEPAP